MNYELTPQALTAIKQNKRCINRLAYLLGRSELTIRRYIEQNDLALTQAGALKAIEEETGIAGEDAIQPIRNTFINQ
jgi:hypothetical protein